ncbi:TMEM175 family protein, partial [Deinococcus radiodurans]
MDAEQHPGPERLTAYTDAVVAIVQTLLILPLLESVSDARTHHLTAGQWLTENSDSVIWFGMNFALIWSFWALHHRIFDHVQHLTTPLQSINAVWMLGIVFLPVSTAVIGLGQTDPTQLALYIGTLLFCSLMMNLMAWQVARDPVISGARPRLQAPQLATSFAAALMYALALVLALSIPGLGYLALFSMFLLPLVARALTSVLNRLV